MNSPMQEMQDRPRRPQVSIATILLLTLTIAVWIGVVQQRRKADELRREVTNLERIAIEFEKLEIRATEYEW